MLVGLVDGRGGSSCVPDVCPSDSIHEPPPSTSQDQAGRYSAGPSRRLTLTGPEVLVTGVRDNLSYFRGALQRLEQAWPDESAPISDALSPGAAPQ